MKPHRIPGRGAAIGQALVEFALVIPLFLLLLFGLVEVGRLIYLQNAFNEAAREAARYGSVDQWPAGCPSKASPVDRYGCTGQVARERIAGAPATVKVDVSCAPMVAGPSPAPTLPPDACGTDDLLTVKVYTPATGPDALRLFTPIIGQLIPAPVVSGQAQVVIQ